MVTERKKGRQLRGRKEGNLGEEGRKEGRQLRGGREKGSIEEGRKET